MNTFNEWDFKGLLAAFKGNKAAATGEFNTRQSKLGQVGGWRKPGSKSVGVSGGAIHPSTVKDIEQRNKNISVYTKSYKSQSVADRKVLPSTPMKKFVTTRPPFHEDINLLIEKFRRDVLHSKNPMKGWMKDASHQGRRAAFLSRKGDVEGSKDAASRAANSAGMADKWQSGLKAAYSSEYTSLPEPHTTDFVKKAFAALDTPEKTAAPTEEPDSTDAKHATRTSNLQVKTVTGHERTKLLKRAVNKGTMVRKDPVAGELVTGQHGNIEPSEKGEPKVLKVPKKMESFPEDINEQGYVVNYPKDGATGESSGTDSSGVTGTAVDTFTASMKNPKSINTDDATQRPTNARDGSIETATEDTMTGAVASFAMGLGGDILRKRRLRRRQIATVMAGVGAGIQP